MTKESSFRESNVSIKGKYVINLCKQLIKDIKDGECSDDDLAEVISDTEMKMFGYVNENDYISAERAMKELGLGKNRNKFFDIIRKNGIKCKRINNQPVGYNRKDIERVKKKLHRE